MTISPFEAHMGPSARPPGRRLAIDAAVLSGFRLICREPMSVLAWGAVYVLFSLACLALFAPVYLSAIANMRALTGQGAPTAPAVAADALRIQGLAWLLSVVGLIMRAVQTCAVCRAVLNPKERRFAYLRLGMAELFLAIIYIGLHVATAVVILVTVLGFTLLTVGLYFAHAVTAAIIIDILAVLGVIAAAIYVSLRLSLIAPLVVEDEKPHVAASWVMTRGRLSSLFAIGFCLLGIVVFAEILLAGALLLFGAQALGPLVAGGATGADRTSAFLAQSPSTILATLAPYIAAGAVVGVPIGGAAWSIIAAPWARAYLDLRGSTAGA